MLQNAQSKPASEEVVFSLVDGRGHACWDHGIHGFRLDFTSPSTGLNGLFFIGSKSEPIGHSEGDFATKSKSNVRSTVYSTNEAMVYDMTYDVVVHADHFGCCYTAEYERNRPLRYSKTMDLQLSSCVLEESKARSTYLSYDVDCDQLQSVVPHSQFFYVVCPTE